MIEAEWKKITCASATNQLCYLPNSMQICKFALSETGLAAVQLNYRMTEIWDIFVLLEFYPSRL